MARALLCALSPTSLSFKGFRLLSSTASSSMDLSKVVEAMEGIAPTHLAESWDNVGLLVQPSQPHQVKCIVLTNDLTEKVMDECVEANADVIVSYHPPIFRPLKRLTMNTWQQRLVVTALENRIAVYSPHTASDAMQNGVNDWLASGLGELEQTKPIKQSMKGTSGGLLICAGKHKDAFNKMKEQHASLCGGITHSDFGILAHYELDIGELHCKLEQFGIPSKDVKLFSAAEHPVHSSAIGSGRLCALKQSTPLKTVVNNLKSHLGMRYLRLALANGKTLEDEIVTVGLCAGSGSSVLAGCKADVYLTGEMSHHEVLDATQNGISVILCEHSNTERGYLQVLRKQLQERLASDDLNIIISKNDKDPLDVV